jgi:hypothetical protein
MCDTSTQAEPVIYSMPGNRVPDMQAALTSLAGDTDAVSISFTDNGSLYLSTIAQNLGARQEVESGSAHLIGVSGVDGAQTGINVKDVTWLDTVGGNAGERQLALTIEMTEPRIATVRFVFDVNPTAVALHSATPVTDALGAMGLDFNTIWCVTKNGGAAILPALISALPSLVGGPGAFLKAVLAALPGAAINTAQSVIANCFS